MRNAWVLVLLSSVAATAALAAPPSVTELTRMLPATAQVVVAVDATALRSHPAVQAWLLDHGTLGHIDSEAARFLTDAGLDPMRDVAAMVAAAIPDGPHGRAVAFFAGHFDPVALASALTKRGATPITVGAVSGFRLQEGDQHEGVAILAQPSPELIVVGSETAVSEALSANGADNQLVEKAVAAGRIDLRAPFWVVATIPPSAHHHAAEIASGAQAESEQPIRQVLMASGTVQRVAIQAFLDDSLRISGVAEADTAENAELLRDAAKGALAALRLGAQDQTPDLVDVLRGIQVRAKGTEVSVSGAIPVALLEKLAAEHRCKTVTSSTK